jgi:photosystem II stability/assembly factor-like uncharacterized protein
MPITKTYAVGDLGAIVRLDNLTGSWNDVSITSTLTSGILYDVETDPADSDKVFVVGEGALAFSSYGIYVSSDAGTNWTVPGGAYQANLDINNRAKWYEVQVIDSSTIYVAGRQGYIAKSTDGGSNFNLSTQIPAAASCPACNPQIQDAYSLHFISDQIGVVGTETHVYKTTDAGATWTALNGGNPVFYDPLTNNEINGIHISADEQTIVLTCKDGVYLSTDAGLTFSIASTLNSQGTHLTWVDDSNLWAFGRSSQILKSTDGGLTWTIVSPLFPTITNNYAAGHFYTLQNGFYGGFKYMYNTNNAAVSNTVSLSPPTNNYVFYAVWTLYFPPICYVLSDCAGVQEPKILKWDILGNFVGSVIQVTDLYGTTCWQVSEAESCEGAVIITGQHTILEYQNCIFCNPPMCYELVYCDTNEQFIVIGGNYIDLSGSVGQIIKVCDSVTNTCYCVKVNELGPCTNGQDLPRGYTILEGACFITCEECNPPVIPTGLKTRSVKPGYDTPGCPPEYTEKVDCTFGEQAFEEMAIARYGINICCDHDIDKWDLKKRILDLKAIYDPNFVTPTKVCTCYTIEQITFAADYTYISCDGCLHTITIQPGVTEYLCSQIYPRIKCPVDGVVYNITDSGTACTSNTDCLPIVIECACYQFESSQRGDRASYIECNGTIVTDVEVVSLGKAPICAQIGSIVLNNPETSTVTLISEGCTTNLSCAPCTCYEVEPIITPEGQSSISYINCNNEQTVQILTVPVFICAKEGSVTTNNADVYNTLLECNNGSCGE